MKLREPVLLLVAVFFVLFSLVPETIYWKGSNRPIDWPERGIFVAAGVGGILLWSYLQWK